jgi:hypothetical protein
MLPRFKSMCSFGTAMKWFSNIVYESQSSSFLLYAQRSLHTWCIKCKAVLQYAQRILHT